MVPLSGPYIFSLVSFLTAACVMALFFLGAKASAAGARCAAVQGPATDTVRHGTWAALKIAARSPRSLFALAGVTGGHMIMVGVMVMTPVHMNHMGQPLEIIGIVISLHILGMYAASPVFGWLVDKIGAARVVLIGCAIFTIAITMGALSSAGASPLLMSLALTVLGLGWSGCLIGGSSLLSQSAPQEVRVPLQGATDMMMNFGAAGMAALAGPILALGGFFWINAAALAVLVPMIMLGVRALQAPGTVPRESESGRREHEIEAAENLTP